MANKGFARMNVPDAASRNPMDFYATAERGTRALLAHETFRGRVWEPACGSGSMSRALEAAGLRVRSTNLHDLGYGETGVDFLAVGPSARNRVPNIVTNPPYTHAEEFVHHALAMSTAKVAMLLRLAWLEGIGRYERVFAATPLRRVHVFSRRLRFDRDGVGYDTERPGGMVAYAWYVWEHGWSGRPELNFLGEL